MIQMDSRDGSDEVLEKPSVEIASYYLAEEKPSREPCRCGYYWKDYGNIVGCSGQINKRTDVQTPDEFVLITLTKLTTSRRNLGVVLIQCIKIL